jgi:hypothetical protein
MPTVFEAETRGGKVVGQQFGGGRGEDSRALQFLDPVGRGAHGGGRETERWKRLRYFRPKEEETGVDRVGSWARRARPEA